MKKSCLIAVVAVLAAVAGALGAVAVYLRRREKELDEYERLLFGEDDAATVEDTAEPAEAAEENKRRPKNIQGAPTVLRDCFGAPFFFEE